MHKLYFLHILLDFTLEFNRVVTLVHCLYGHHFKYVDHVTKCKQMSLRFEPLYHLVNHVGAQFVSDVNLLEVIYHVLLLLARYYFPGYINNIIRCLRGLISWTSQVESAP